MGALVKRYQATGTVADLDEAIVLTRAGLARTQDDQPGPAHFSGVLSELLFLRHRQAGAVADLDEAIRHERVQLRNPALDRRRRASVLNALGLLLRPGPGGHGTGTTSRRRSPSAVRRWRPGFTGPTGRCTCPISETS
ncbi:hypothetical protein STANM309S_05411 [Streptomyces tanashiensis]